ncbi:MAG: 1-deoxy-D-xylulose-5-phosphate reductoisomerase [Firmicutes bacterium HGW-Firmicutes-9]|jgi:1-deoxy-D-xylulose-5-phosphate reductoisomerase|nr:MAG: 1-deoxy-D-xylulose-5-phosphate reductoisomerase [Firmicutes bacterium HGW-Firmicutes-9]
MKKQISVLGCTGSIGRQSLDVIASHPEEMTLFGVAANRDINTLLEQVSTYHPRVVACETEFDASLLPSGVEAIMGTGATEHLAGMQEADVVVNGVSGFAALSPLVASLKAGKRVALANKESIVCGKSLIDNVLRKYQGEILPVDSEQSAIFQCLQNGKKSEVDKLILTASGGPFWRKSREELANVTPEEALAHPTWNMGKKITLDSATLFNKGLEVIEAAYLFDLPAEQIEVLIHPQSIVHSMVSYIDGTCMANMSKPDMRLPIQYAITYPDRIASSCTPLSLYLEQPLTFHKPDLARFHSLKMAYDALKAGLSLPLVYNGANEAAVEAFCSGRIGFLDIERVVDYTLNHHVPKALLSLEEIIEADRLARDDANIWIERISQERRNRH